MNLEALRERLAVLNAEAQRVRKTAEDERRDLTAQEAADLDRVLGDFDRTKADIDRLERLDRQTDLLTQGPGRQTQPDLPVVTEEAGGDAPQLSRRQPAAPGREQPPGGTAAEVGRLSYVQPRGNWHFSSLGDFALSVRRASVRGGQWDRRLELSEKLAAASTYGSEGVGADGGFAVPPDFRAAVMQTIMAEDALLPRCDLVTCSGNSFTCPVDETTPWQTSGGILSYWDGEAAAATQSKPNLQDRTIKLNKLRALVPMTEELLDDAAGMDAYLRKKAPEKISFKINDAVLNGSGVGMPLGVVGAPGTKSVAKESSQTAATLIARNVMKMYNAMYAPSRSRAVWLYNPDVEPELFKLAIPGTDNVGNAVTTWGSVVYMPPGGLSQAPYGTLYGRPAIPTQACQTLGTVGDILFVDLSQYLALLKSGVNPRVETSMHLWFDQDLVAYKFVLRLGGMPWWSTTMAAKNGSATYSPIVSLATRA